MSKQQCGRNRGAPKPVEVLIGMAFQWELAVLSIVNKSGERVYEKRGVKDKIIQWTFRANKSSYCGLSQESCP